MLGITLVLLIERPVLIGKIPARPAKRIEVLAYSKRALAFTGFLIVAVSCAGVGSIVLVRRANAEFRRQSLENMKSLVDGTIDDHKKKSTEDA